MAMAIQAGKHVRWTSQVALVLTVLAIGLPPIGASALMAPPEATQSSYHVDESARALIAPMNPQQLGDDREFVRVLATVFARPDLTLEARVDAFTLMLGKIGWLFNGTAPLPKGFSYPRMFQSQVATFLAYQQASSDLNVDGATLLALGRRDCATDAIRCASAILLTGIVDPKVLRANLPQMLNSDWIQATQVPSITLHALAMTAVLARDPVLVPSLGALLNSGLGEEEHEDVLAAIGMYAVPESPQIIKDFLFGALDKPWDQATETAVIVLHHHEPPVAFAFFYEGLLNASKGKMREALTSLRDRDFQDSFSVGGRGTWQKIWDGFSIVMYEDGMLITYGETFRAFEPKRPKLGAPEPAVGDTKANDA